MGAWDFDLPVLNSTDQQNYLTVKGPLDPSGLNPIRGDVVVRYELIQHLQGQPKAIIDGFGTWNKSNQWSDVLSKAQVDAQLSAQGGAALAAGPIRGIATAIVVTDPPATTPDDEPIFMTITWCVGTQLATA
jgi:hypothetical protein